MTAKRILVFVFVILGVITCSSCAQIGNLIFPSMADLPEGELLDSYDSPTSDYTINIYLCSGGATTDFAIRGELVEKQNKSRKNIYWNYHEDGADVEWVDGTTVVINGHTLHVLEEVYDFRK